MDLERVKRPAALAGRVRGRAKLRHAKARTQCDQEQVVGEFKRSDDRRRCKPCPRPLDELGVHLLRRPYGGGTTAAHDAVRDAVASIATRPASVLAANSATSYPAPARMETTGAWTFSSPSMLEAVPLETSLSLTRRARTTLLAVPGRPGWVSRRVLPLLRSIALL